MDTQETGLPPIATPVPRSEVPKYPRERIRSLDVLGAEAQVVCRVLQKVERDNEAGIPEPVIGGTPDQIIATVAVGIRYLTKLEEEGRLP